MADFLGIGIVAVNNIHTYLGYQWQLSSFCTCFFKINAASYLKIYKMKRTLSLALLLFAAQLCRAQRPISGPLSQNVWFDALGSQAGQGWGSDFMAVLPAIPGIAQHPMAISENGGADAAYILNRFPFDTARIYTFPGGKVVPGHISGSPYTDFVCWDPPDERITVLFGTAVDSVFDTALVLQGQGDLNEFGQYVTILVDNFDSSDVQGIIIGDPLYQNPTGDPIGRILFYRGGSTLDTTPNTGNHWHTLYRIW